MSRSHCQRVWRVLAISVLMLDFVVSQASAEPLMKIRAAIEAQGAQWIAGETSMSKLTDVEKEKRLGLMREMFIEEEKVLMLAEPLSDLPSSIDWRANGGNYVTPVKDQEDCGSCWAFAATGALESYILLKEVHPGTDDDRAEQMLVSCSIYSNCGGGYISEASDFIRNTGLPPESYFPYTATNNDCDNAESGWDSNTYQILSWSWVTTSPASVSTIKNALYTYGPLITTMDVYSDFFSYTSGVYQYTTGGYRGGHAILLVGYVDNASVSGGGYFIVKNSWGTGWGQDGYFSIAYSQVNSPVYFGEWTIAYHRPASPPPAAPTGLRADAGNGNLIVGWDPNEEADLAGYKLYYGTTSGNYTTSIVVGNGTYYSISNLMNGTPYYIAISAYNADGVEGPKSEEIVATPQASTISVKNDFNGDDWPDLLWRNNRNGSNAVWYLNGTSLVGAGAILPVTDQSWQIAGTDDFNGDGWPDLLWRNTSNGSHSVWYLNGITVIGFGAVPAVTDQSWQIVGTGDFNGDGWPDLLWRNSSNGSNCVWYLNGTRLIGSGAILPVTDQSWQIVGIDDFNGDGRPDLLWRNSSNGSNCVWYLNETRLVGSGAILRVSDQSWQIAGTGDFNGDGWPDLLWRNSSNGSNCVWYLNGTSLVGSGGILPVSDQSWQIKGP